MNIPKITWEDDKFILDFETGTIYNKFTERICVSNDGRGYLQFKRKGKNILNHRFLIECYYGFKLRPYQRINHINNIRDDNRLDNLEIVTTKQNYSKKRSNNTSGCKGVRFNKQNNKWRASIMFQNKNQHLGYFFNIEDAKQAYITRAKYLNEHHNCKYLIEE
jgi:hypothetical protein